MEAISQLQHQYQLIKLGVGNIQSCINWAMERLQLNQEGSDLEIVLLAASTEYDEAFPLVQKIVTKYLGIEALDDQLAAGRFISELHTAYLAGSETIETLDAKFTKIFNNLGYPNWLVMLSRNCEYATDVDAFKEPFEQEFSYVAGLWAASATRAEFESAYSREISNQHDAKYC